LQAQISCSHVAVIILAVRLQRCGVKPPVYRARLPASSTKKKRLTPETSYPFPLDLTPTAPRPPHAMPPPQARSHSGPSPSRAAAAPCPPSAATAPCPPSAAAAPFPTRRGRRPFPRRCRRRPLPTTRRIPSAPYLLRSTHGRRFCGRTPLLLRLLVSSTSSPDGYATAVPRSHCISHPFLISDNPTETSEQPLLLLPLMDGNARRPDISPNPLTKLTAFRSTLYLNSPFSSSSSPLRVTTLRIPLTGACLCSCDRM
jgi:hypothetical protein